MEECPKAVKVRMIVLGYGDVSEDEMKLIWEHLEICPYCLDIYNMNVWLHDQSDVSMLRYKLKRKPSEEL